MFESLVHLARKKLRFVLLSGGCLSLTVAALGQSVTGRWTADWRVLDNGEKDMIYLDLQQQGGHVSGTMTTIGHVYQLQGKIVGNHFELFSSGRDTKPRLAGDVAGKELHLTTQNDMHPIAYPSPSEAGYPPYDRLPLPPLHDIAPNSALVKTPPMGWNSCNLVQSHSDDKTVRDDAEARVES